MAGSSTTPASSGTGGQVSLKDQGNEFFKAGNYLKAAAIYTQAIKQDPNNPTLYSNRAAAFLNLVKLTKALADADMAISLSPKWEKGYFRKGCILEAMERYDEALDAFQVASQYNPQSTEVSKKIKRVSQLAKDKKRAEEVQKMRSNVDVAKHLSALKSELSERYGGEESCGAIFSFLVETMENAVKTWHETSKVDPRVYFLLDKDKTDTEKYAPVVNIDKAFESPHTHSNCFSFLREYAVDSFSTAACLITPKSIISYPQDYDLVPDTWHSLKLLGLPVRDDNFQFCSNVDVAVIDSYRTELSSTPYRGLHEHPIETVAFHARGCKMEPYLSDHGLLCAAIIAGKKQKVNLDGVCEGFIKGVAPGCKLHLYTLGCSRCQRSEIFAARAVRRALMKNIKVISISMGVTGPFKYDVNDFFVQATLAAYKAGILVCMSAGNNGPRKKSIKFGYPWCMTIGACTSGKLLRTQLDIAVRRESLEEGSPYVIREVKFGGGGGVKVVDVIEGFSYNLFPSGGWYPLKIEPGSENQESHVYIEKNLMRAVLTSKDCIVSHSNQPRITKLPLATLSRVQTNRICDLQQKLKLYIKVYTSRFRDDDRGLCVPHFSARGPGSFRDVLVPDLVAPGVQILTSTPEGMAITDSGAIETLYKEQHIVTGTSYAAPHIAGAAAYMRSVADWGPGMIKSAMITSARSFAQEKVAGNEFDFGAGLSQPQQALKQPFVFDETWENYESLSRGDLLGCRLNTPTFAISFPSPSVLHEETFQREVTCVADVEKDDKLVFSATIEYFHVSLDPDIKRRNKVTVEPQELEFHKKGERRTFKLKVRNLTPRPGGYVSALLHWRSDKSCVSCPMHFYQEASFGPLLMRETDTDVNGCCCDLHRVIAFRTCLFCNYQCRIAITLL